jgi:hypothetical protein
VGYRSRYAIDVGPIKGPGASRGRHFWSDLPISLSISNLTKQPCTSSVVTLSDDLSNSPPFSKKQFRLP